MSAHGEKARTDTQKIPVVAEVVCELEDGERRTWYVTRFSLVDMFVLAMRPPPIGTEMKATLRPLGLPQLPPLTVRVVSALLDPSDAGRCGFGAIITSLDDAEIDALFTALTSLGLATTEESKRRPSIERRQDPRVWIDLGVYVLIPGARFEARVTNLSMSGALISFGTRDVPPDISPGVSVDIDLLDERTHETVSLSANVVRLVGVGRPTGIGVRFTGTDSPMEARLEAIMLHALGALDAGNEVK